jgi:adenylate cyclase
MPTDQNVTRKLSAILSADVKGYSILMADDEVHTIQTLKAYRQIISDLISHHSGRVVDSAGDNILAEFRSAVGAVGCAVEIQRKLKDENARYVDEKKVQFRIGVNVGDVVQDGDRIYGSGVNVAARIEGIAEPGGICISRNTYDHVKDKLDVGFEYLGEHDVKNIEKPVRVYKVLLDSKTPKPLLEEKLELPDKPSIAVLPFDNMSGDTEQEYFSDGITEDIITSLSRSPWMFVIARNSSFSYRDKSVDVKIISRELGVRYILEGSVRKAGNRIRVTAQLIDGIMGSHVWAEKYDGELQDIFDLQDQITQQVVATVQTQIKVSYGEKVKNVERPNVATWELLARGWKLLYDLTKESLVSAEKILRRAVAYDPTSCEAHLTLACTLYHQVLMGHVSDNREMIFLDAYEIAKQAVSLNEKNENAHWVLGMIQQLRRKHDLAIAEYERAIELNPNFSLAYGCLGDALGEIGNSDESIKNINFAIRLNPMDPSIFFRYHGLALAHFMAGRYSEASQWARKSVHRKPSWRGGHALLASSLAQINLFEEAKEAVKKYLKFFPNETISDLQMVMPITRPNRARLFEEGLRKAGLPD